MTSRERVAMLLRRQLPDRMGLYDHYWPETIRDRWSSGGYPDGVAPEDAFDYDLVGCGGWLNTEPFPETGETLEESADWSVIRDGRGATLRLWKAKSGVPEHIGFTVTTPEAWARYREPLLDIDEERLGDVRGIRASVKSAHDRGKFAFYGNLFVFELMRATIGDAQFLPALLLEPDWIRDFCQVYLDMFRAHYELLFRQAGLPDGFFLYEDFGFRNGLFCSPKVLGDLVMPFEKQLVGFLHDYGLPVILHSCGDIRKAVPLIIEAGFDCLQPMEAKAGCDVLALADEYGDRIAYMGNINVVELGSNDPERIRTEVLRKVRGMRERRAPYFFHSDHSLPPDISLASYRLALELFRENGTY